MEGHGIMNPSSDVRLAKVLLKPLAVLNAHRVDMVYRLAPRGLVRQSKVPGCRRKQGFIPAGVFPALFVPLREAPELHLQYARLNGVQPPVVSLSVVIVLSRLAMV